MSKFDLGILLVILVFMLLGYYKGLVRSALSLVQYFVVTILSVMLAPTVSKMLIETFNFDLFIVEWIRNNENLFFNAISIVSEEILKNIAGRIINVLSVIILFILLKIVCMIVIGILNKIANLPILNVVNKVGGLLIGAVNGILVVYLLILLINWLPLESLSAIRDGVKSSFLGIAINSCVPEVAAEVISMVKTTV